MWIIAQARSPPKAPEIAEATFGFCEKLPWDWAAWELTEEERNAEAELFALVPVTQEERHGGEQTPLEEPEKDAGDNEGPEGFDEAGAHAHDAPEEGDGGDDAVELQSLDPDRGGELGENVKDVEDGYGRLEMITMSASVTAKR